MVGRRPPPCCTIQPSSGGESRVPDIGLRMLSLNRSSIYARAEVGARYSIDEATRSVS